MNDEVQLEVVDLGDAKEETKGVDKAQYLEPNEILPFRETP
ncbi:rubrivinodin family lasso peptide [Roseateles sp. DC23W]|uniref:Rubrivinodin family lasso peptide n=1 Tax=Pelomonas dachongensis TaxID=3299029 RepID=A0ABW7EUL9_9BURK